MPLKRAADDVHGVEPLKLRKKKKVNCSLQQGEVLDQGARMQDWIRKPWVREEVKRLSTLEERTRMLRAEKEAVQEERFMWDMEKAHFLQRPPLFPMGSQAEAPVQPPVEAVKPAAPAGETEQERQPTAKEVTAQNLLRQAEEAAAEDQKKRQSELSASTSGTASSLTRWTRYKRT